MPLTRRELDTAPCSNPDCTNENCDLVLGGACHPGAPVYATYVRSKGCLTLVCSVCKEFVTRLAIASREEFNLFNREESINDLQRM
jgi:hypothetical protein